MSGFPVSKFNKSLSLALPSLALPLCEDTADRAYRGTTHRERLGTSLVQGMFSHNFDPGTRVKTMAVFCSIFVFFKVVSRKEYLRSISLWRF